MTLPSWFFFWNFLLRLLFGGVLHDVGVVVFLNSSHSGVGRKLQSKRKIFGTHICK